MAICTQLGKANWPGRGRSGPFPSHFYPSTEGYLVVGVQFPLHTTVKIAELLLQVSSLKNDARYDRAKIRYFASKWYKSPTLIQVAPPPLLVASPTLLVACTGMQSDVQSLQHDVAAQLARTFARGLGFSSSSSSNGGASASSVGSQSSPSSISPIALTTLLSHILYRRKHAPPYYVRQPPPPRRRLLGFPAAAEPPLLALACCDIVRICARWIWLAHNHRHDRLLVLRHGTSTVAGKRVAGRIGMYKCVDKPLWVPRSGIVGRDTGLVASSWLRRRMGLWNTNWITCGMIEENGWTDDEKV